MPRLFSGQDVEVGAGAGIQDCQCTNGHQSLLLGIDRPPSLSQDAPSLWFYLCGLICCNSYRIASAFLIILKVVALSCIVIGSVSFNDCHAEPSLPVLLIILGSVTLVVTHWHGVVLWATKGDAGEETGVDGGCCNSNSKCWPFSFCVIKLPLSAIFIYTCIIVFGLYSNVQHTNPDKEHYCGELVYVFSLWMLTCTFMACGLAICVLIYEIFCAGAATGY